MLTPCLEREYIVYSFHSLPLCIIVCVCVCATFVDHLFLIWYLYLFPFRMFYPLDLPLCLASNPKQFTVLYSVYLYIWQFLARFAIRAFIESFRYLRHGERGARGRTEAKEVRLRYGWRVPSHFVLCVKLELWVKRAHAHENIQHLLNMYSMFIYSSHMHIHRTPRNRTATTNRTNPRLQ